MQHQTKKAKINRASLLILLCWLVYTCSYIGKLSYNANISQIGIAYGVNYSQTGMVATFFFFAYGAGQIINGMLCKHYNIKYVIAGSLLMACAMNLLVVNVPSFSVIKYLWLIDGFAMSFLWSSLIRLLSETLSNEDISKAVVAMGTTTASGTFITYGLSAGLAVFGAFRVVFYIAAIIMGIVALTWLFAFDKLVLPLKAQNQDRPRVALKTEEAPTEKKKAGLYPVLCMLALFAIANNLTKDGLTSWTPDILAALYDTPGWLSILLTLLLPVMAIGGVLVSVKLHQKLKDFVAVCTVFFLGAVVLIATVLGFLSTPMIVVTICCLAIVSCMMAGVNNVITSIAPLHLKGQVDSGKLAGVLNGFCYMGSTISSYGLGLVADQWGWKAVFILLLGVSIAISALGGSYLLTKRLKAHK